MPSPEISQNPQTRPHIEVFSHFQKLQCAIRQAVKEQWLKESARHLGPLLSTAIKGVAHNTRFGCRSCLLNELVIYALMHKGARARCAALALQSPANSMINDRQSKQKHSINDKANSLDTHQNHSQIQLRSNRHHGSSPLKLMKKHGWWTSLTIHGVG